MPLDALCLAAVCNELSGQVIDSKIDKITQPEQDAIILSLRGVNAPKYRLLISAGAGDARIHLTDFQFENPAAPPMFCMLLRKHLIGARIIGINQLLAERVLEIVLSTVNTFGDIVEKRLIVELIGSVSNIILIDDKNIIIDCLRRIGLDKSGKRAVLPGLIYHYPTSQAGKHNPFLVNNFEQLLSESDKNTTIDKWLLTNFCGLSPLICRELSWRVYGTTDFKLSDITDNGRALCDEFNMLIGIVKNKEFNACLMIDKVSGNPCDFSFMHIKQYEDAVLVETLPGFSELLESYYSRRARENRIKNKTSDLCRCVKTARDRVIRKLITQKAELETTADRDYLRQSGDIIIANLHLIKKGQKELIAHDYYSQADAERKIVLDPLKTPQQNAQWYYKKYTKAKNAEKFLSEQIVNGEKELEYLESVLEAISFAENESDIQEIRQEISSAGYLRLKVNDNTGKQSQRSGSARRGDSKRKHKTKESVPMKFLSSTGMQILAGKSNVQNDKLTLKTAGKSDVWLHAQKIHGAHVVVSCSDKEADQTTLNEAAIIAAYFSSARLSANVPVDYTFARYVKKPSGGKPGMVIYSNFKTINATPDEKLVMKLRVKN